MKSWSRAPKVLFVSTVLAGYCLAAFWVSSIHWGPRESIALDEVSALSPRDIISNYCSGCHTSGRSGADFDLAALDLDVMRSDRDLWVRAVEYLRDEKMPPTRGPSLTSEDRERLIRWLESEVLRGDPDAKEKRFVARRLQRVEYVNAIRELLGVHVSRAVVLPADDPVWRPRTDAPAIASEQMAQYTEAAHAVIDSALAMEDSKTAPSIQVALLARALAECAGPEDRQVMVRDTMASLARRAFRRPIDALEADRMLEVFSQADGDCDDAEAGIRGALVDVLTSPRFLYRMEPAASETADAFALASRLSFFLWASVPDDELLREAEQGTLLKNLEAQTRRMVKAPPARDLPARIGNIWLGLDSLGSADPTDASLVKAMRTETEKLIEVVMHEDRPVTEFLDADYTYVNQRLAEHYGIRGIQGDGWQRVSLRGTHRAGLWTHASVLRISTGGAELTSPVQRGKWILENLVGQPVPRPPAGLLETLAKPDTKSNAKQASFREQTERHRADPSCAQCHIKMDAIGLSLENFDGRGAWRSRYPEGPVDATGVLSDKETLHGPDDTKAYLLRHSSDLVKAISGKLLANALGRKLNQYDRSGLPEIAENVAGDSYRFSRMIVEIVQSPAFLRGGQPSATAKN